MDKHGCILYGCVYFIGLCVRVSHLRDRTRWTCGYASAAMRASSAQQLVSTRWCAGEWVVCDCEMFFILSLHVLILSFTHVFVWKNLVWEFIRHEHRVDGKRKRGRWLKSCSRVDVSPLPSVASAFPVDGAHSHANHSFLSFSKCVLTNTHCEGVCVRDTHLLGKRCAC